MATETTNYGFNKDAGTDYYNIAKSNANLDLIDTAIKGVDDKVLANKFQTAGGTATAITLTDMILAAGNSKTFIVSANNNGAPTTINGKPLYKPDTVLTPTLNAGRVVTVWYDLTDNCFFTSDYAPTDHAHNEYSPLASPSFTGTPKVDASTAYTTAMMRNIQLTATDPGVGVASALPNGTLIAVYTP